MRTKKWKGFTLIELIVVMAIFSVVMVAATSLMTPVAKIMVASETQESGNAAVNSISSFIEGQISTAEYLYVNNRYYDNADTTDLESKIKSFVNTYYGGVLANGATPTSPVYGSADVHVLTINNDENGKISTWTYSVSFDPSNMNLQKDKYDEWAVNKAYYDDYLFEIKPGVYNTLTDFDAAGGDSLVQNIPNMSSKNSSFTIKATTQRNHTNYSFLSTSTMSLVNIFNRGGGPVEGQYYIIDNVYDYQADGHTHKLTPSGELLLKKGIKDIASDAFLAYPGDTPRTKIDNAIMSDLTGDGKGFTFIYTYGSEINTQ